jgi:hypothetical protein
MNLYGVKPFGIPGKNSYTFRIEGHINIADWNL